MNGQAADVSETEWLFGNKALLRRQASAKRKANQQGALTVGVGMRHHDDLAPPEAAGREHHLG
jgi:hypothetical protein